MNLQSVKLLFPPWKTTRKQTSQMAFLSFFLIWLTNNLKFSYLLVQKLIPIPKEDYCNITSLMIVMKQLFVKKQLLSYDWILELLTSITILRNIKILTNKLPYTFDYNYIVFSSFSRLKFTSGKYILLLKMQ